MDYVPSLDFIASMFTSDLLDQDEFGFEFSDPTVPSTLISFNSSGTPDPVTDTRKRKGHEASETKEMEKNDEFKIKRMRHRDVERQRRQEVASLFKNLRSLLPLQYIKGKRSSSDHVLQAVNYIKDIQKRIKELGEKKDRIKKSSDIENRGSRSTQSSSEECSSSSSLSSSCSCAEDKHMNVVIMPCLGGFETVISCCFIHMFCLSSVLHVLSQEEGFNVVRCTSTRVQQRFIHHIVAQVDGARNINFAELQEKIMKMKR